MSSEILKLQTHIDYWNCVVLPDCEAFLEKSSDLRLAFHAATSLFHVSDWIYQNHKTQIEQKFTFLNANRAATPVTDSKTFANSIGDIDGNFELLRNIANAGKHHVLMRGGRHVDSPSHSANVQIVYETWQTLGEADWNSEKTQRSWDQMKDVKLEASGGKQIDLVDIVRSVRDTWLAQSAMNNWGLSQA